MDSEFFRGGVWAPTYFIHAKFEVKYVLEFFHLQSTLDSEFFRGGVWTPTFFIHTKFEVKNFLDFFIYRVLWTLNFSGGVSGHHLYLDMLNLRSKFFHLHSTLDS